MNRDNLDTRIGSKFENIKKISFSIPLLECLIILDVVTYDNLENPKDVSDQHIVI